MIAAFNAVLPVFLLMVLGFFLFHIRLMTGEFSAHLNRLVYWIGLPSLLFREIATQTLDWGSVSNILLAFFLALSGTILIAYAISFFQKMDESTTGSFVQAAYRGNLGFIGLPIVLYSATQATQERMPIRSLRLQWVLPRSAFNLIDSKRSSSRHQPQNRIQNAQFAVFNADQSTNYFRIPWHRRGHFKDKIAVVSGSIL